MADMNVPKGNQPQTPYQESIQAQDKAQEMGVLDTITNAIIDSAWGTAVTTEGARNVQRLLSDSKPDPVFRQTVFDKVHQEFPGATNEEKEFLLSSQNAAEYQLATEAIAKSHQRRKLADSSALGTVVRGATNLAPDLAVGFGTMGAISRIAKTATRVGVGAGVGGVSGGVFEYARQKGDLAQSDMSAVVAATAIGALAGGIFDGLPTNAISGAVKRAASAANDKFLGLKVAVETVQDEAGAAAKAADTAMADVAKAADNVTPEAAAVTVAKTEVDDVAENIVKEITGQTEQAVAEKAYLQGALKDLAEATPMGKAFMEAQAQRNAAEVAAEQNARLVQEAVVSSENVVKDSAVSLYKQMQNDALTLGTQDTKEALDSLAAKPNLSEGQAAWADLGKAADPTVAPKVLEAEAQVPAELTTGRLRFKDGTMAFKPLFDSPVDRALATVGSQTVDPTLAAKALGVLHKAFPGHSSDALVRMADHYTNELLMPMMRSSGKGAPKVGRWWDKLNPDDFADQTAKLESHVQQVAQDVVSGNAKVEVGMLARHADDVDGALLQGAVDKANKWVTKQTIESGFAFVKKSNPALADTMDARLAAYAEAFGAKPPVHEVRQWMAEELYNRSIYNAAVKAGKQAGFIQPRFLLLTGGVAGAAMLFAPQDANASTGGAAQASSFLAEGAVVVLSAVGVGKLLKSGKLSGAMKKVLTKATPVASKTVAEGAEEGAQVAAKVEAVSVPVKEYMDAMAQETKMTAEAIDALHEGAKAVDAEGKEAVLHTTFANPRDVQTLHDMGKAPIQRLVVTVKGKEFRVRIPERAQMLSADWSVLANSTSATIRGLGMLTTSSVMSRMGKKATEMASDQLYKSLKTRSMALVAASFDRNLKAYLEETGQEMPSMLSVTGRAQRVELRKQFSEQVYWAKLDRGADVSQAAKTMANDLAKLEAEHLGNIKRVYQSLVAKGVEVPEDSVLKRVAELEADPNYVSRVINRESWQAIEKQVGPEGVQRLIAKGMRAGHASMSEVQAMEAAQRVYATLSHSQDELGVFMPQDKALALVDKLRNAGLDDATIDTVMHSFGVSSKPRAPGMLKSRKVDLDMTMSEKFMVDGKEVEIRLGDLYERDITRIVNRWTHTLSGLEAVATSGAVHGIDLTSHTTRKYLLAKAMNEGASEYEAETLEGYWNLMLGLSRDEKVFGNPGQFERMIRAATTYWMGSGFVFAQAGDIGGMGGGALRNLIRGFAASREFRRAFETGAIDKSEAQLLADMMDVGLEQYSAAIASMGDDSVAVVLNGFDKGIHIQQRLTGMFAVENTVAMAKGFEVQHFVAKYLLGEEVDDAMWKHWSSFGLDKELIEEMRPMLTDAMVMDGKSFRGFDFGAMKQHDILLARRYQMAIQKAGQLANAKAPGMGMTNRAFRSSALGRFMGQLQGTAFVVTQRSLRDMFNMDSYVLNAWITSMAMASLSHMAKVYVRYAGDDEEVKKRLTYEQLFLAAVRNSSFSGLLPNLIDAGFSYTGVMPGGPFSGATNSGRSGGGQLPVQALLQNLQMATGSVMGVVKGDPYDAFTQNEARTLANFAAPVWWMQPLVYTATQGLPTKNPKRPAEEPAASPFN